MPCKSIVLSCSMVFSPNDSPLAGREGTQLTGSKIGERLANEAATSVSLRVIVKGAGEAFEVQARGELQLGLLIGVFLPQMHCCSAVAAQSFAEAGSDGLASVIRQGLDNACPRRSVLPLIRGIVTELPELQALKCIEVRREGYLCRKYEAGRV